MCPREGDGHEQVRHGTGGHLLSRFTIGCTVAGKRSRSAFARRKHAFLPGAGLIWIHCVNLDSPGAPLVAGPSPIGKVWLLPFTAGTLHAVPILGRRRFSHVLWKWPYTLQPPRGSDGTISARNGQGAVSSTGELRRANDWRVISHICLKCNPAGPLGSDCVSIPTRRSSNSSMSPPISRVAPV